MDKQKSIVVSIRDTIKQENQDWDCKSRNELLDASMIAIADGLGSFEKSEKASYFVLKGIKESFKKLEKDDKLELQSLFEEGATSLDYSVNNQLEDNQQISEKSFGTTCICAIETSDRFKLAYSGNGAILHLKGNFIDFPEDVYYLPWCLNNYLNPHTIPENGREALYKYFSYGAAHVQYSPTTFELSKDNEEYGDIIIICSDGLYSSDHNNIGKDSNDIVWQEINIALLKLIKTLRTFALENEYYKEEILERIIKKYLEELKGVPSGMDDDCSIGIIITEKALSYFKTRQKDADHKS